MPISKPSTQSAEPVDVGPETPIGAERTPVERGGVHVDDWVAVEEPLEIRLDDEPLVVTLRTPGDDVELATGFLFSEAIIEGMGDLVAVEPCRDPLAYDPDNLLSVTLSEEALHRRRGRDDARRQFAAVAACGLCGKARLEDVFQRLPSLPPMNVDRQLLASLPERMRQRQRLFDMTGGLHAAALFDAEGELLCLREDIGRHNAVDKVVGWALRQGRVPLHQHILVVSARAGFEIVQKAAMAEVPVLAAVGAASSLAVRTAKQCGLNLYAFLGRGAGNRHL